jgi:8-amino-7-oxononanoate synthase
LIPIRVLGVLGKGDVTAQTPYGSGRGGLTRFLKLQDAPIVVEGTLSKALGVPVSFIAGPVSLVRALESSAGAAIHSSPPSVPNTAAALEALRINKREGDQLRRRVAGLVFKFQRGLRAENISFSSNGIFPIQTIPFQSSARALQAAQFLRRCGIWPLLQLNPPDYPKGSVLRFMITAAHRDLDVDRAVEALAALHKMAIVT